MVKVIKHFIVFTFIPIVFLSCEHPIEPVFADFQLNSLLIKGFGVILDFGKAILLPCQLGRLHQFREWFIFLN
jgi:hypothetical protein